jgi:imidazolonepropionase-like amidohydrolase
MKTLLASCLALAVIATHAPARQARPQALVLTGAHVLDPAGERWVQGQAVLVVGDKITQVAPSAQLRAPENSQTVDLEGFYVVPGLIDLHTHLLLHPYNEAKWDDQVLRESLEARTLRAVPAARLTLEAGFTTVRDLGTEGAGFADIALRDSIAQGLIVGPRVVAATRAIVATGCYGPAGFDPRWVVPQGAEEVTGADAMRQAVRRQIAAGADWVKVYADYRRSPGSAATATLSPAELDAATDEARSAGRKVSAHATTDEGIRRAITAGVATIEHGYGATRETFELMKQKGAVLCPTMAAAEAVAIYTGWRPGAADGKLPPGVEQSHRSLRLAREIGVTIACGSDAGVFAHGANARELELMVEAGLTPGEALRAATVVASKVLGKEKQLGSIADGALADLVALRADPLADISALRGVAVVIAGGRVVVDRR